MVLLTVMIWLPLLLLSRIQLWYRPAVELLKWKIFNPHIHRLLISQWGRRSRCEQIFYEVFFEGRKKNTLTNKHLKKKKTKLMQLIKTFSTNKFSMWKTAIKNILSTQKVTFWCCFHKKKTKKNSGIKWKCVISYYQDWCLLMQLSEIDNDNNIWCILNTKSGIEYCFNQLHEGWMVHFSAFLKSALRLFWL